MGLIRKAYLVVAVGTALLSVTACNKGDSKGAGPMAGQKQAEPDSRPGVPKEGIAEALKKKKLAEFKTVTIGEAFDTYRYFDKREWKESRSANGKIFVDFWGWFKEGALDAASRKNGVVARGVQVKFVINPEGDFYLAMISRAEKGADGSEQDYPLDDKAGILKAIYGNKEITF